MLWRHKATIKQHLLAKIYKIEADLLADNNHQAWTNLGLWHTSERNYVNAAEHLAEHMGQTLHLSSKDHVLDVGCGYGASLYLWNEKFKVTHMSALELQPNCCKYMQQQNLTYVQHIFQQSIFDPKPENFNGKYDVIMSVDATYHYPLKAYLQSLEAWISAKGRIGFHLLMRLESSNEPQMNTVTQDTLKKKLKWAKIDFDDVLTEKEIYSTLQQYGYQHIQIEDLSQKVFRGFYTFVNKKEWSLKQKISLGYGKIYATASLCKYLADSQYCAYVQITAQKA